MLSERDMQELSNLSSKLAVEGYDVDSIKAILSAERAKINAAEMVELLEYFGISDNIGVRLAKINYGFNKLTLNITATLEKLEGIFNDEGRPDMFEGVLRNSIFNCLKNIKTEYIKEVEELSPITETSTEKTASVDNPLIFTIATNVLYAETGTVETAIAWTVSDIKDSNGDSIDNSGTAITATSLEPLNLEITDGTNDLTFNITSGTFDGTSIVGNNVAITGGI